MGHEVAGLVVEVGADVDPAWLGARVACETHHQVCDCIYCRDGRRNLCFNKTSMGSFVDGGFASHVVVPQTLLHRIPDGSVTTLPHSPNRSPASATCCSTRRSWGPGTVSWSPDPGRWASWRPRWLGRAGPR